MIYSFLMNNIKMLDEQHVRYEDEQGITPTDATDFVSPKRADLVLGGGGADTPLPTTLLRNKQLEPTEEALLLRQWHEFNRVRQLPVTSNPLLERTSDGVVTLPQGTLLHGTAYSPENLQTIKDTGILSGEFVGVPEDLETHYCADFFRVPDDMTTTQYQEWLMQSEFLPNTNFKTAKKERNYLAKPLKGNRNVTFIVDSRQPELGNLLRQDVYREGADPLLRKIINELAKMSPLKVSLANRLSSILCGIPSNGINGIIVGDGINTEEVANLKRIFGDNMAYFSATGELLQPTSSNSPDTSSSPQQ
jgi:hypothetical protein